jgi:hypothetical protein
MRAVFRISLLAFRLAPWLGAGAVTWSLDSEFR